MRPYKSVAYNNEIGTPVAPMRNDAQRRHGKVTARETSNKPLTSSAGATIVVSNSTALPPALNCQRSKDMMHIEYAADMILRVEAQFEGERAQRYAIESYVDHNVILNL